MLLSIIVPVYNVKDYLDSCMESILGQDLSDCEILLVDDGSTDGFCPDLCDSYKSSYPEVIRSYHKKNGGLGDARDYGVERAQGEYLLFIDSDDRLAADAVKVVKQAISESKADVIDFGFATSRDGHIIETFVNDLPKNEIYSLKDHPELLLSSPSAWCKCWKRALLTDHKIYFPARLWFEDICTTTKLIASSGTIYSIQDVLYLYEVREGSITRNPNPDKNKDILTVFEDILGWFSAQGLLSCYEDELCQLTVDHVLLASSVRVLRIDPAHSLLGDFLSFTRTRFPSFKRNHYYKKMSLSHRLLVFLLEKRCYRVIQKMFDFKK